MELSPSRHISLTKQAYSSCASLSFRFSFGAAISEFSQLNWLNDLLSPDAVNAAIGQLAVNLPCGVFVGAVGVLCATTFARRLWMAWARAEARRRKPPFVERRKAPPDAPLPAGVSQDRRRAIALRTGAKASVPPNAGPEALPLDAPSDRVSRRFPLDVPALSRGLRHSRIPKRGR